MKSLPPLNGLRAFEAAARLGGFAKAAAALNITPSAVSHRIRGLEAYLGVDLFDRQHRDAVLTPTGAQLLPGLTSGFRQLSEAVGAIGPGTPDDVLVVTSGPAHAAKWLAPRLHRFVDKYPDIEIRIAASLKCADLAADGIDVAIRHGDGQYQGVVVEQLFTEEATPLTSRALADGAHPLRVPDDLQHHTLLHDDSTGFLSRAPRWADWLSAAGATKVDGARGLHFNHADHGLDAAAMGGGVVLGRCRLAAADLRLGRLVAPFGLRLKLTGAVWFCHLPGQEKRDKIAAFRDWVFEEVAAEDAEMARLSIA